MKNAKKWAEVAVARPLDRLFTYRVPEPLRERLQVRTRVQVPFGRRCARGIVVRFSGPPPENIRAKEIEEVLEDEPLVTEELFELLVWVGSYYGNPIGEVVANCVPLCRGNARKRVERTKDLIGSC